MRHILVIIDDYTEDEILRTENSSLMALLPQEDDKVEWVGRSLNVGSKTYTIARADSEPKLDRDCNVVGIYTIIMVK